MLQSFILFVIFVLLKLTDEDSIILNEGQAQQLYLHLKQVFGERSENLGE